MSSATPERVEILELPAKAGLEEFVRDLDGNDRVGAATARNAAGCVNTACKQSENLIMLTIETYGKRVLCPVHAIELISRELGREPSEIVGGDYE